MTPAELAVKAKNLADKIAERQQIDDERKAQMARLKDRIESCDLTIGDLAKIVRTRKEEREVECSEGRNDERLTMDSPRPCRLAAGGRVFAWKGSAASPLKSVLA